MARKKRGNAPSPDIQKPESDQTLVEELEGLLENPSPKASSRFIRAVGSARFDRPEELTDVCGFAVERVLRGVTLPYDHHVVYQAQMANQALDKLYALAKSQGPAAIEAMQKRLTDLVSSISEKDLHSGYHATNMGAVARQITDKINRHGKLPEISADSYLGLGPKLKESPPIVPVSMRESYEIGKRARRRAREKAATHGMRDLASTVISGAARFCLSKIEKWDAPRVPNKHGRVRKHQIPHSPKSSLHPERVKRKIAARAAYFIADGTLNGLNFLKREAIIWLFSLEDFGRRGSGPFIKDSEHIPPSPKTRSNIRAVRPKESLAKRFLKSFRK